MATIQRKPRWRCPYCDTVNRAHRDVCFGVDCNTTRADAEGEKAAALVFPNNDDAPDETDGCRASLVEFKDENSKVIGRISPGLASCLRTELVYMVQNLVRHYEDTKRGDNLRRSTELQKRIRKGVQAREDFEDSAALWGYARRKFFVRAIVAFELFRSANEALLEAADRASDGDWLSFRHASMISIGGGPGNDLFGALLYEKYGDRISAEPQGSGTNNAESSIRFAAPTRRLCAVWDFAPGWKPICDRVGNLSGHRIAFERCDLSCPLRSDVNTDVYSSLTSREVADEMRNTAKPLKVTIFLFCYVLSEVMGPFGKPPPLLEDMFSLASSGGCRSGTNVFLFREPNGQALRTLLAFHPEWKEREHFWNLSYGGLMIVV